MISSGAPPQTLQGTYSDPHTPICWRGGVCPSFNFLAKLPILEHLNETLGLFTSNHAAVKICWALEVWTLAIRAD